MSFSFLTVLFILSTCLISCFKEKQYTIIFWHHCLPERQDILASHVLEFEKRNRNIKIQVLYKTWESMLYPLPDHETFPDIAFHDNGQILRLAESGLIQPIDTFIDEFKNRFVKTHLKMVRHQGHYYAFPITVSPPLLFFNPKMVRRAPSNLMEMAASGRRCRQLYGVKYSLALDFGNAYYVIPYILSYGGRIFDGKGYPTVNRPGNTAAIRKTWHMFKNVVQIGGGQDHINVDLFKKGKVPFLFSGVWRVGEFLKEKIPFRAALFPDNEFGGLPRVLFTGECLMVKRGIDPDKKKMIYKFFKYLLTGSFGEDLAFKRKYCPSFKRPYRNRRIIDDPVIRVQLAEMKRGIPINTSRRMGQIWGGFINVFWPPRGVDLQILLDRRQQQIDRYLAKYRKRGMRR